MICLMRLGLAMRATPPSARIMAGTRSNAMTEVAPASSAMRACSTFITSIMTPPLSISANPIFRRRPVLVSCLFALDSDIIFDLDPVLQGTCNTADFNFGNFFNQCSSDANVRSQTVSWRHSTQPQLTEIPGLDRNRSAEHTSELQ